MALIDIAHRAAQAIGIITPPDITPFEAKNGAVQKLAEGANEGLPQIFFQHRGRNVWKWTHYLECYERHFADWRGKPVRVLEIGVLDGGSLELWREYFGDRAAIFGIDIDERCAGLATAPNEVRIGSQGDADFLRTVVEEMGGVDIVIDDGSHVAWHQRASFDALFPMLSDGGVYAIEDMHTSYWPGYYQGGHGRRGTAVGLVKQMIDDLHGWYHTRPRKTSARDDVRAVHIYDSLAIIEKGARPRPSHVRVGGHVPINP